METTRLNPDNRIIGENIAKALQKANPENRRDGITAASLARAVSMNKVSLARVMAGTRGASEEKLIEIAAAIPTHPGNLILGITPRAREDRFPHIPAPTNRNKRDTARKGMAVASVEALVKNPSVLSSFFGGIAEQDREHFRAALMELREKAHQLRVDRQRTQGQ